MISEKNFIEQYKNFWDELFPGITNYLRKINKREIFGSVIEEEGEIKSEQNSSDLVGYVNDIAFRFFESELKSKKYDITEKNTLKAYSDFKKLHKYKHFQIKQTDDEQILKEVGVVTELKNKLSSRYKNRCPIIHPQFFGCGFQNEVYGDIIYEDSLVEVKARGKKSEKSKSAGFRRDDLIQLFIYAALYFSEQREERAQPRYGIINCFELYNPRLGCCWKENVDIISENISGGSAADVYDEIIRFLSYTNTSL